MNDFSRTDLEEALQAITSIIDRTEKAKVKFTPGTSQHTLQANRLNALHIALSLITDEVEDRACVYEKDALEKAVAPIASLISKSEKARMKLAQGTWPHTMLSNYLKALYIASPLLTKALNRSDEV